MRYKNEKLTTEDFILRSSVVHGNKYDYSKVIYKSAHIKINIICPQHGIFNQTPSNHLYNKRGCFKCVGGNRNTNEFIKLAQKIHGDKYNYSESIYTKSEEKICIICPQHGKFYQTPIKHLNDRGCPVCANNIKSDNISFISKAINIHKDKYDYSLVNYITCKEKIQIICKLHGKFYQTPSHHLSGQGCKKCAVDPQINHNGFKRKEYIFSNGRKELVQGYEPWTLDYLLSTFISSDDIIINGKCRPVINYSYNGESRCYFPDCYISSSNTIVETKSTWTMKKQTEQNFAKITGSLQSGYNMRVIIWNRDHTIFSDKIYK